MASDGISEQFLKHAKARFGNLENSSSDYGDRVRSMVAQVIELGIQADNVTVTDAVTESLSEHGAAFGGGEVTDVLYVLQAASVTISATDNITVSLIKKKAPSYSLTFSVATLTSTTDGWTPNGIGTAAPFTLSTLSDNLAVHNRDAFHYIVAKNGAAGANGHTVPLGKIVIEIR